MASIKFSKSNIIALTFTALAFVCIGITAFFLVYSNLDMNSKQGLPDIQNCVLNFADCDIEGKYLKQHMQGEYEFFYNKWIIEDDYKGEPDAIVSVPHHFKDTSVNGERLSNVGYASYRMYVTGLPVGTAIYFLNNNFIGAQYGYINGQLIYKYGTRQKSGECKSNGGAELTDKYYVTDGEPLEVVFEISSSKQGGLTSPPRLMLMNTELAPTSPNVTNNIGFIVLGLIIALFIFSFIVNFGITADKRDFSFVLVMLSVMLLTVFSVGVYWRLLTFVRLYSYNIIMDVNFFACFLLIFSVFLHFIKNKVIVNYKPYLITLIAVGVAATILYFTLMGTFAQVIAPLLQCACLLSFVFPLSKGLFHRNKWNILYMFFLLSVAIFITCNSFDLLNLTIAGLEQSISYILFPVILCVIILYRRVSEQNSKKLIAALKSEQEHNAIKADALKAQIKPHFIFNSLANIQSAYERNKELGDQALNLFSKHLRANVNSGSVETVPFSQELDNIMNYIELENMRRETPINVLLDCYDVEFSLPILSLQPFIENAFKYSGVEKLKDGYVEIKTTEDKDYYYVRINDNGLGFNPKTIKKTSVGLKNARERLSLISSAVIDIKSKPNCGTKILIKFPKADNSQQKISSKEFI